MAKNNDEPLEGQLVLPYTCNEKLGIVRSALLEFGSKVKLTKKDAEVFGKIIKLVERLEKD